MSTASLLTLSDIALSFDDKVILKNIDLTIHDNEIVTIVGPNGAGKSTLIRIALGLQQPDKGTVTKKQGLTVGYVPQSINRDYTMPVSVKDFIGLTKIKPSPAVYQQILTHLSLTAMQDKLISDLSGGELRRVLFARALLAQPDLLVLDEPTAGVDVNGQQAFYHDLNALRTTYGFAILMVSHDLHLVMSATDRVICLNQHICCQGKPTQVMADPHYQFLFAECDQTTAAEMAFYEHDHDHTHE